MYCLLNKFKLFTLLVSSFTVSRTVTRESILVDVWGKSNTGYKLKIIRIFKGAILLPHIPAKFCMPVQAILLKYGCLLIWIGIG
jgi:hypothetical protein